MSHFSQMGIKPADSQFFLDFSGFQQFEEEKEKDFRFSWNYDHITAFAIVAFLRKAIFKKIFQQFLNQIYPQQIRHCKYLMQMFLVSIFTWISKNLLVMLELFEKMSNQHPILRAVKRKKILICLILQGLPFSWSHPEKEAPCALRLVETFWLVETFVLECLNFNYK